MILHDILSIYINFVKPYDLYNNQNDPKLFDNNILLHENINLHNIDKH